MKFQVTVFWVVTPCSDVVGYQRFGRPCYLLLQGPPKRWHPTSKLQGFKTQETSTFTSDVLTNASSSGWNVWNLPHHCAVLQIPKATS